MRVVHAKYKHGRVIFARGRHQHFFRACKQVFFGTGFVQKQAGGFNHHIRADRAPVQVGRIPLLGEANGFSIHHQRAILDRHVTLEASVHAVVLQHVGQVIGFEQVVDAHDFDVRKILHRSAKHHAPDAPEAVDTYFDSHENDTPKNYFCNAACTVSATFSGVKPKCWNSTGAGADSP